MNESLLQVNRILELVQPNPLEFTSVKRIGSVNDGGYVVIDDFSQSDFLISMGVGDDINFELEVASRISGMDLYDHTISQLPSKIKNARFFREKIGKSPEVSILEAIDRSKNQGDLILKMDIEGSEWEVLSELEEKDLIKFRQLIIEFHSLSNFKDNESYIRITSILERLSNHFYILNSHANNCGDFCIIENIPFPDVIEISYARKSSYSLRTEFSKALDNSMLSLNGPCSSNFPEIYLQKAIDIKFLNLESTSTGKFSRFDRDSLLHERDSLLHERDSLLHERDSLLHERDSLKAQLWDIFESRIWRWTSFYRTIKIRRLKN